MIRLALRLSVVASALLVALPAVAMTNGQAKNLFLASATDTSALAKLEKAAKSGDPMAEDWLGLAYQSGYSKGLPQSYTAALKWFEKAAAKGIGNADFNIACMYQVGAGVPQSYRQARHWYAKAAARGSVEGRYTLHLLRHDKSVF